MVWVVFSIIIFVVGVCLVGVGTAVSKNEGKAGYLGGGAAVVVAALLLFFVAGFKEVPVKTVGVVTSFGHIDGFMGPGIHHTWPWKTVNLLPETVQTTAFTGGFDRGGACEALDVRIGGQQQACLDITIQWQVKDQAADRLFNLYDTSGKSVLTEITDAVVVQELKVAVNQEMGDYNPIQDVAANTAAGNSQFSTFGPLVKAQMVKDIGSEIAIRNLLISFAHYDSATQARLNAIQQQYGATAIAQEQIATNGALSKANAAIAAVTPNELVQECLNIVQDAEKTGYQLPAGFGNCVSGTSTPISVSAK